VEVVDRDGAPVPHAPVAIFWGEFDPVEYQHYLPADERGRLVVSKLEAHVWSDYRGPVRVSLAAGVPCVPELVEFSMQAVPREPIRLVAGDHGSVAVQLVDEYGRPLALDGMAGLDVAGAALAHASLAVRGGYTVDLPLVRGRAVFPCVGLGLPLEVGGGADGHESFWREVAGPVAPGETREVLVPIAERTWTARVRTLGIEACFPGRRAAPIDGESAEPYGSFSGLAREGEVLELPIRGHGIEQNAGPWRLELYHPLSSASATVVPRRESFVLDFGDVTFQPDPEIASFRVVDPEGRPAGHAVVRVEGTAGMLTDGEGRCVLRGEAPQLPLRVRGEHEGWLPSDWVQVDSPGAEATLTLRRAARLEGRLLLPPRVRAEGFVVTLASIASEEGDLEDAWCVEGGRFRFDASEPGVRRLTVEHDDRIVAERTGIELVAGETTVVPDIDVRDALFAFTLSFELASGEPWEGGHLEVRAADGPTTTWTRIGPSAIASFLAPTASVDLWACGRGARPQLFEGVLDGDLLVLQPGPSVVLRLSRGITLPAAPFALCVSPSGETSAEAAFAPDPHVDVGPAVARADGTVRLRVPAAGAYELEWSVLHTSTGAEIAIEQDEWQTIRIEDGETRAIDVLLTADELERALRAARGE
jgi:hypothetical protein